MSKLKILLFIIFLFGMRNITHAQNCFNAIIKDSITNETLIGAVVVEDVTTNGTIADVDGKAKLLISKIGSVSITIKYAGYADKTISILIPQKDSLVVVLLTPIGMQTEEVTVSSVRTNSRIEDIPTRVEVLGMEDMKEENGIKPGNIMSLLGDIAGIQMQQISASSGNTYARIQGLNGRYTQLLKDGMPLFGGLSGSFGIMQIPPLDLKQIEIIKGYVSTLYGGDAIGGIINLVSKQPTYLNYSGTFDSRTGGDMRYFPTQSSDSLYHVKTKMQRNNADAKWLYEFSKNSNITAKISSSYLTQNMGTNAYNFNANQLLYYSEISYVYKNKKTDWVTGINFNGDKFINTTPTLSALKNYSYQTIGVFIQNTWRPFDKFIIESGFRGDYHSEYGFFPLPRLSLMYKINKEFTTRINGGYGYKIPNLITYINPETDLKIITSNIILKPELSQGINGDINYQRLYFDKLNVTLNQSFFLTNISQPVFDSSSTFNKISLANANKILQTKGLQTYARLKYEDAELYLGYVFTDVIKLYDLKNPLLAVTPKHNFSTTAFYEIENKWRFGIESSLIAGQLDQNYQPVKNYFLFAAMIQYNIRNLTFVLNGENLLDFRQSNYGRIYDGSIANPAFHKLWAPIDGRVINLSVKWKLR
ncbi:MAG: TonB-dependent receptor [Bacteroidetes bacterium]|nr:TonB-dependent receptor [Bacteroidota bacterium]